MTAAFALSAPIPTALVRQPRAIGAARLVAKAREGRSVIGGLRQSGSLKLLFPRTPSAALTGVLLNTAGGITGGDRFEIAAEAGAGTHLTLTTQAAERAYRAQPGETGRLTTRLRLAPGARLDWLPQETILFDHAALDRRLSVDMASDSRLLLVEPLVFGRAAMGESLRAGHFRDRIEIRRDGRPVFADRSALEGDIAAMLARPAIGGGAGAMATVILASPDAGTALPRLRATLPETAGASLVRDGLLFARLLADDGFALRAHLLPMLAALDLPHLPRPWMI